MYVIILVNLFFLGFSSGQDNFCPTPNGRFPHPKQCDAYFECEDGVAQERLCPDGLLFNPKSRFFAYPCQYPVEVDCEGRSGRQTPRVTDNCPHSYGYFRTADSQNCGQFVNCVEGRGFVMDCPLGLAFNEDTLQCDWPDQVPSCDAEAFLGFRCPSNNSLIDVKLHRNVDNCRQFFICIDGKPRLFVCPQGQGFSAEIGSCQSSDDDEGCEITRRKDFEDLNLNK